ncbi:MAG: AMP-binding protein, partial [Halobacteria archaeon]|nr:AMP-binding protein [Halobacteria archaeon]
TGDRVALLTRNRVEYVTCVLGVVKSGATMLPLNSMLANDDYEYMLTDSGAGTLICGSVFAERVNSFRDSLDVDDYFVVGDSAEGFEEFDSLKREGDGRQAPEVDVSP